ncbi:MAG: sacsin N-terminal ATP-binding-like domain-containing protein, partial [Solirubrobacteraceae bacterium]
MQADDRAALGPDVGAAVMLAAFSFDAKGRRVLTSARPVDAYLPRAIDREPDSFALAADHTPGFLWLHSRFAETLRSPLGRGAGLGPQRFLRLLGAEIAPRLVVHPESVQRFSSDSRRGLHAGVTDGPPQRAQAMRAVGATYTVDDFDSPDLRAVVKDIAREKKVTRRRERAGALLGALGRAWDRMAESAEVMAATDHYGWNRQGAVRAFWLWSAGSVAWLDDAEGTSRTPLDLRLRTPATVAVHGSDATGYLRPEFDVLNRRDVLAA